MNANAWLSIPSFVLYNMVAVKQYWENNNKATNNAFKSTELYLNTTSTITEVRTLYYQSIQEQHTQYCINIKLAHTTLYKYQVSIDNTV